MGNGQVHNLSDVSCEMKQFGTRTSQSSANGSFAMQGSLVDFSEALVLLCNEVIALRSEINELKALHEATTKGNGTKPRLAPDVVNLPKKPR